MKTILKIKIKTMAKDETTKREEMAFMTTEKGASATAVKLASATAMSAKTASTMAKGRLR